MSESADSAVTDRVRLSRAGARKTGGKARASADGPAPSPVIRPPDISYRWFRTALSRFLDRERIPNPIDQSTWNGRFYGSDARNIVSAFRFLGLIDQNGQPTRLLFDLTAARNTDRWEDELRRMLATAYSELLRHDTTSMTSSQLFRVFRETYGMRGTSIRACTSFFLHAAQEAQLPINPFLFATQRRGPRTSEARAEGDAQRADVSASEARGANPPSDVALLLSRLPEFNKDWPDDIQRMWFSAFKDLSERALADGERPQGR